MERAFAIIGFTRAESGSNVPFAAFLFTDTHPEKKMLVNLHLGDIQTVEEVRPASTAIPDEPTLYIFHRLPSVQEVTIVRLDKDGNGICSQKASGDPAMLIPKTTGSATERLFNPRDALSGRDFRHISRSGGESERPINGSKKRRT